MARIRSIKPELRTSITVSTWPREVRYFFVLLWGYFDDYGRGVDDELLIASDCFPRDRDITPERVDDWLELIADSGPLCRYEVDGRRYLHAPNWREHQKPSHPTRSKVPPCPDDEPSDFKKWREDNPQRLRNRSRKSREAFQKIPKDAPSVPRRPSRALSETAPDEHEHDEPLPPEADAIQGDHGDETAGHDWYGATPESLANPSGNAPEHFVPEQGSKGAREQGSKGEGGVGGNGHRAIERSSTPHASRSDDRPPLHELPDDFELTGGMRRWAHQEYPRVDVDSETTKFRLHYQGESTRRRNWYAAWQKWIAGANDHLNRHGGNVVPFGQPQPRPSTTDARVQAALDLGRQMQAEYDAAQAALKEAQ